MCHGKSDLFDSISYYLTLTPNSRIQGLFISGPLGMRKYRASNVQVPPRLIESRVTSPLIALFLVNPADVNHTRLKPGFHYPS